MLFLQPNFKHRDGSYQGNRLDVGMPFFLHLRSDLLAKKVSPYIAFNIGYNLGFGPLFGGILIEPSFGVSFNIVAKSRMNIGLVFPVNGIYGRRYYDGINYYYSTGMGSAINLRIGISF
jgi:hypothetical protein